MAGATLPAGTLSFSSSLAANTVDTVTFVDRYGYVAVTNSGTAGAIYVTTNGVAANDATTGQNNIVTVNPGATVVIANQLPLWDQSALVIAQGSVQYPTGAGSGTNSTSTTANGQPGRVHPFMSSLAGKGYANPGTIVSLEGSGTNAYTVTAVG